MNKKFLEYYLEKRLYLENPPLTMKKFIDFCDKRGVKIRKEQLERLEKKGLFYPIFRCNAIYNEITKVYTAPGFSDYTDGDLLTLYNNDYLYLPKDEEFVEFDAFYDIEICECKVYSYYSSFQIHPLILTLKHEEFLENPVMDKFIDILIATQIYAPYGRSNMRNYSLKTNYQDFHERLREFDLEEVFEIIDADEDELYAVYARICNELKGLLGSDYAIQLWKCIDWKKKDKCIGHTRLGIEYLQWAMMLKRCIEDYLGREIFDVDEAPGDWKKIKYNIPSEEKGATLRGYRNEVFTNQSGEYEFNIKRRKSFYLANSLTLDYHPKILLFVEGNTEKTMISKFFEFIGFGSTNLGIEIIDIGGILRFYSSKTYVKNPQGKPFKAIVNNFQNLIQFNLELWQAIPCFIGDRENGIVDKLVNGKMFDANNLIAQINEEDLSKDEKTLLENEELNENMVSGWRWIWDNDFEIDNFSPDEIHIAINEVCGTNVTLKEVKDIYNSCMNGEKKGINEIHPKVKYNKIEINKKAFEVMVEKYKKEHDETIENRKIFQIIDKLIDMALLNHSPVNTEHSMMNKKDLNLAILRDYDIFKRDEDGI